MQTEIIQYNGCKKCLKISDGIIDLVITLDVGPRIVRFGFVGKDNIFKEYAEELPLTGGDEFHIFGGHRLWHSPEIMPRTYFPDNTPVKYEDHKNFIRFIPDPETVNGIQKEIDVELLEGKSQVRVTHRLRNIGPWAIEFAPWALSVMATEGTAIAPLPPRGSHTENLLHTSTISFWAYTDVTDPRWMWGKRFIMLRQNPQAPGPQKIGFSVPDGWVAYARKGQLFVKQFRYQPDALYPDGGCCVEFFNRADMAEVESLGPMVTLQPGQAVEHVEFWSLLDNVPQPNSETDIETNVLPRISSIISNKV
ncbi:MAG: DUF4380 domain-containing protein [Anaerolineae bacterium]|nr:DUF4380 domain-containing protein [Anaerolineae bacterium]